MKLLCEYKRNSAKCLFVGFNPRSVGVDANYQFVQTDKKLLDHCMEDVAGVLMQFGIVLLRWEVVRRLSRKEKIGAVLVTCDVRRGH